MNVTLKRTAYRRDGILSKLLTDDDQNQIGVTLEHAFETSPGTFQPVLPAGVYVCQRGKHLLEGMTEPFETFEVTKVPGHTGILFHPGNTQKDSLGCILPGESVFLGATRRAFLMNSREAFRDFMALQDGCETFQLTVIS